MSTLEKSEGHEHCFSQRQVRALQISVSRTYRAELAATGSPIGAYDLQIAGHVHSWGATLVTNNLREFSRVSGLRLADWVSAAEPAV